MKARLVAAAAGLLLTAAARAGDATFQSCLDKADGVDPFIKDCGEAEIVRQDKVLNDVYRKLMAKIDKEYQDDLKASERNWLAFREAECKLEYDQDAPGTDAALISQGCTIDMTDARIKQLSRQLSFWSRYGD